MILMRQPVLQRQVAACRRCGQLAFDSELLAVFIPELDPLSVSFERGAHREEFAMFVKHDMRGACAIQEQIEIPVVDAI